MKQTLTTADKMLALVELLTGEKLPVGTRLMRLYPGYWQRSAGAWSWCVDYKYTEDKYRPDNTGSQWPMTELLRHHAKGGVIDVVFSHGDLSLIPDYKTK